MAKYMLVYKAEEAFDVSTLPKEEVIKEMKIWGEWLGNMGKAVVDEGDAFKFGGKTITSDGVGDADNLTTGYTIIEAKDFDEALELAQGSPHLSSGGKVEVYEAFGL